MKILLLAISFLLLTSSGFASHILGGEITYRCLGNGQYRFQVVLYRDCSGIPFNKASVTLQGPVQLNCPLVATYDATPTAATTGLFRCNPPTTFGGSAASKGGIAKFVYEGTADLSGLGAAPASGYTWSLTGIPCCRNSSNNTNCNGDVVLRITMYSFVDANGAALTPAQLCDNSPVFFEDPAAAAVLNPYDTVVFSHAAQDPDVADEARFFLDLPWNQVGSGCSFISPYSMANPIPGLLFPGQAPVDSLTGSITYRPVMQGSFNLAVRVESRRCGQKISEIFRDFQLNVINNPAGSKPLYNPSADSVSLLTRQKAPVLSFPGTTEVIELYANDTVEYAFSASDIFPLYDTGTTPGTTGAYNPDSVTLLVESAFLGAKGTSLDSGCISPPCAVLTNQAAETPEPVYYVNHSFAELQGYGFTALREVDAKIRWIPGCSEVINESPFCEKEVNHAIFRIVAMDDNQPVRGVRSRVLQINIVALPALSAPVLREVSLNPSGTAVRLFWTQDFDSLSVDPLDLANNPGLSQAELLQKSVNRREQSFQGFELYRAELDSDNYQLVASFSNRWSESFTDTAVIPGKLYKYRLANLSGCGGKKGWSETLKTIDLVFGHNWVTGAAEIQWDSLSVNNLTAATGTGDIRVERENFDTSPGSWVAVAIVNNQTSYMDMPQTFGDSLNYRVGFVDSLGNISYSRSFGSRFDLNSLNIDELSAKKLNFYPNPAQDIVMLQFEKPLSANTKLLVRDMEGKLMLSVLLEIGEAGLYQVSLTQLAAGQYQLMVVGEGGVLGIGSLVKQY